MNDCFEYRVCLDGGRGWLTRPVLTVPATLDQEKDTAQQKRADR